MSTDEDRFWPKVDMTGDCWLWIAAKDHKGYGKFSVGNSRDEEGKRRNSMVSAHRFAYELVNGAIPYHDSHHGLCVLHKCDTPACVKPSHLFLGTNADNVKDMDSKGRRVSAPQRGEQHALAKITELQAREVYMRAWLGDVQSGIAADFGISVPLVSAIKVGRLWPHLTPGRSA